MSPSSPAARVKSVLQHPAPFPELLSLAQQLRDEGLPQPELTALFDSFREHHAGDEDQSRYDAVLDTLDQIVGWCSPSRALYPASRTA